MQRYHGKLPPPTIDSNGNPCCRWCNNIVVKPRRTLCSPLCAHEIKLRCSNRYMRDCTYARDKGICSICNIDTKIIAKQTLSLIGSDRETFLQSYNISFKRKIWKVKHGGGLWDADHILPVKDGGGLCGLDNIRTLCISCHKIITSTSKKISKI
jgi:5-methylcytosine-specific restriction protein A